MDEQEKSVFIAKTLEWKLERRKCWLGGEQSPWLNDIYLSGPGIPGRHLITMRKSIPLDDIFFPDLYDRRNAYFTLAAIFIGWSKYPNYRSWLEDGTNALSIITSLDNSGIEDALDKLVEEINANT